MAFNTFPRTRKSKVHRRFFSPLRLFQITMFMTLPFILLKLFATANGDYIAAIGSWWFLKTRRNEVLEDQLEEARRERAEHPVKQDDPYDYFKLMEEFKKRKESDLQELQSS
eukprot:EG_transcript_36680